VTSLASDFAIRTEGLTKRFGSQLAVNGVDLRVPSGAVFGFLGPNGSGKTTTIRLLLGLASATSGEIEVLGRPMPDDLAAVLPEVVHSSKAPAFTRTCRGLQTFIASIPPTATRHPEPAAHACRPRSNAWGSPMLRGKR